MDKVEWTGQERRTESHELTELRAEFKTLQADVHEIKELLTQGKGAVKVLQLLFYIGGPIVMVGYWIKDHLK